MATAPKKPAARKPADKAVEAPAAKPKKASAAGKPAQVAQAVKAPKAAKPAKAPKPPVAVKPAKAAKAAKPPKAEKSERADKTRKPKLVRDSFTIPKTEYAVIDDLKQRAAQAGAPAKKSELLRAGIKALAAMDAAAFLAALQAVPALKTGRPAKD